MKAYEFRIQAPAGPEIIYAHEARLEPNIAMPMLEIILYGEVCARFAHWESCIRYEAPEPAR